MMSDNSSTWVKKKCPQYIKPTSKSSTPKYGMRESIVAEAIHNQYHT